MRKADLLLLAVLSTTQVSAEQLAPEAVAKFAVATIEQARSINKANEADLMIFIDSNFTKNGADAFRKAVNMSGTTDYIKKGYSFVLTSSSKPVVVQNGSEYQVEFDVSVATKAPDGVNRTFQSMPRHAKIVVVNDGGKMKIDSLREIER